MRESRPVRRFRSLSAEVLQPRSTIWGCAAYRIAPSAGESSPTSNRLSKGLVSGSDPPSWEIHAQPTGVLLKGSEIEEDAAFNEIQDESSAGGDHGAHLERPGERLEGLRLPPDFRPTRSDLLCRREELRRRSVAPVLHVRTAGE